MKFLLRFSAAVVLVGVMSSFGISIQAGASVSSPADGSTIAASRVRMELSSTQAVVDSRVTVTVVVLPRSAGRVVTLQRRAKHGWRNLAVGATSVSGKVIFHLRDRSVITERIGAIVAASATGTAARGTSQVLEVVPVPPPYAGSSLSLGDSGAQVLALQQRLSSLGYWVGVPNGSFGDATQQAVYAVQKAAGLPRTGVVGPTTVAALQAGILPTPRSRSGYVIEIDLKDDLILFVRNGVVEHVLNTSTGGGYTYTEDGETSVATTPTGVFNIGRVVNGLVVDSLGALWRPRFFYEGFAIHGDSYVPPEPVSHGCARVSIEAIDWIWSANLAPVGTEVSVYG